MRKDMKQRRLEILDRRIAGVKDTLKDLEERRAALLAKPDDEISADELAEE